MKKTILYILAFVWIMLISGGLVVPAFEDNPDEMIVALCLTPPCAFVVALGALLTWKVYIPRFLMKDRYAAFLLCLFVTSYIIPMLGLVIDYYGRTILGLNLHGYNYLSPWILLYALIVAMMDLLLFAALSISAMYRKWKSQDKELVKYEQLLKLQLKAIHDSLDSIRILPNIDRIIQLISVDCERANEEIRSLSEMLRKRLYRTEDYPVYFDDKKIYDKSILTRLIDFLTSDKYRLARHLILQIYLLLIATGTCFETPDYPNFNAQGAFVGIAAFYISLNLVIYGNVYLLLPRFLKRGKIRLYFKSILILVLILIGGLLAVHYVGTVAKLGVYRAPVPLMLMIISTIDAVFALVAYSIGTSSIVIIKQWLMNNLRINQLKVDNARYRLDFLRKQINPHFLFNTLNNAGIIGYDDPEVAVRILSRLRDILRIQMRDTDRATTTVGDELSLLNNYLELEKTRKEYLNFDIVSSKIADDCEIPTLLLIPFVENAVKYYDRKSSNGRIDITIYAEEEYFCFECINPFDPNRNKTPGVGGLGISNTRSRLDLIFNGKYKLTTTTTENLYIVKLRIPLRYEMYNR